MSMLCCCAVGVCGMSCSGKSTVSSVLRAFARERGSYVPVICLDDSYHAWMSEEAPCRDQRTNFVPPGAGGTARAWKNWDCKDCIDWTDFYDKLQAKIEARVCCRHCRCCRCCRHCRRCR